MPVFFMFISSSRAIQLAGEDTKAAALAQERMETLKGGGYAQLKNKLQGQEEAFWQETAGNYQRQVALKCLPLAVLFPGMDGEVIFLQVSVSRGEGDKRRTVSFVSLLGEGGEALNGGS